MKRYSSFWNSVGEKKAMWKSDKLIFQKKSCVKELYSDIYSHENKFLCQGNKFFSSAVTE